MCFLKSIHKSFEIVYGTGWEHFYNYLFVSFFEIYRFLNKDDFNYAMGGLLIYTAIASLV